MSRRAGHRERALAPVRLCGMLVLATGRCLGDLRVRRDSCPPRIVMVTEGYASAPLRCRLFVGVGRNMVLENVARISSEGAGKVQKTPQIMKRGKHKTSDFKVSEVLGNLRAQRLLKIHTTAEKARSHHFSKAPSNKTTPLTVKFVRCEN